MGYEHVEFKIVASLSRRNAKKDEEHDKLWEDVIKRIDEIVNDTKYDDIALMTF